MASKIRELAQILSKINSQFILSESRSHTEYPIKHIPVKSAHIHILRHATNWSQPELLKCDLTSNGDVHFKGNLVFIP